MKVYPAFNFMPIEKEEWAPKSGQQTQLMYIKDMYKKDKCLLFTQMCDCGYRMCRENVDYSKWNQCIYEDIDYKKYMANNESYTDPKILYEKLHEWLYEHYKNVYYYMELSRSKKGYHIIFYFNVMRTKQLRMICKAISDFIVKKAFKELGYEHIIEYDGVFDDCSDSFYQACFMTLNDYHLNNECDGMNSRSIVNDNYYSIESIYNKLYSKTNKLDKHKARSGHSVVNNESNSDSNSEWKTEYLFNELNKYNGGYLNHHERYYLFKSIVGLCGIENEELIKNEWENCAEQLIEGNEHNTAFYINEPYKNDWVEWIKKYEDWCYVDKELLEKFGYNIKFINQNNGDNIKEKTYKTRKAKVYL